MVRPGAQIKKPRVKFLLVGLRTALMVCQAINMAMTVVLPAPVASFKARRISSGLASLLALARWSSSSWPPLLCGATSVSQMAVSAASTWQKKGRTPLNLWWRQCCSKRAVSGVTCHWLGLGRPRHVSTAWRTWLMMEVVAYCWDSVERFNPSLNTISPCWASLLRFLGFGMGVMNSARLRVARICWVGWPSPSSSQCRCGQS